MEHANLERKKERSGEESSSRADAPDFGAPLGMPAFLSGTLNTGVQGAPVNPGRSARLPVFLSRLAVGPPGVLEQRAAATAEAATERGAPESVPLGRLPDAGAGGAATPVDRAGGAQLSPAVRGRVEPLLGYDLGHVRVHTGARAQQSAAALEAAAFTYGNHIWLGAGQSPESLGLMAHESAHVVQQGTGMAPPQIQRQPSGGTAARAAAPAATALSQLPSLTPLYTTADGDTLPAPLRIDWGEPFEFSFATRTTGFGDVRLRVAIRYLGAQAPATADDQVQTRELYPDVRPMELGKPQNRRVTARIIHFDDSSITLDAYGDGTSVFDIVRNTQPAARRGGRDQRIEFYHNGESNGWTTFQFKSAPPGGIPDVGTGKLIPIPKAATPLTPPGQAAPQLPAKLMIQMIIGRLAAVKSKPFRFLMWAFQMQKDLSSRPDNFCDPALEGRLQRLLDLLVYMGPIFESLDRMNQEEYLGELRPVALAEVARISDLYTDALVHAYSSDEENEPLKTAEEGMARFPDFLTRLYLLDSRGVRSLIDQIPQLQDELRAAQDLNDPHFYDSHHFGPTGLSHLTKIIWRGKGPGTLADEFEQKRQDVEIDWRKEDKYVHERITDLYSSIQTDIGVLTTMTVYEQLRYFDHELNTSLINDVIESPVNNLSKKAADYATRLWYIVNEFDASTDLKGSERSAVVSAALTKAEGLLSDSQFQSDVDDFATRLKWVNRIDFVAKLALIVAAAAITSGLAGGLAGTLLETAGFGARAVALGELAAGSFAFTAVDRLGTRIAFGKTEGNFFVDWFWNFATFGVLKAADIGFVRIIRLSADAGKFARISYKLGRAGTAMVAMEGLGELHSLLGKEHRLMTGDELSSSIIQNAVMMTAMSAGKFITEPIETRLTKGIAAKLGLDKAIAGRLRMLAGERKGINELLRQMDPAKATSEEIGKLIAETEKLWAKELELLDRAEKANVIDKGELETALGAYREHIAGMQLRLAQVGVEAPAPGINVFTPVRPGLISYKPEGRAALNEFYNPADPEMPGKSLTESQTVPGALEGHLPNGQVTYFIPEATLAAEFSGGAAPPSAAPPPVAAPSDVKVEPPSAPEVKPAEPVKPPPPPPPPAPKVEAKVPPPPPVKPAEPVKPPPPPPPPAPDVKPAEPVKPPPAPDVKPAEAKKESVEPPKAQEPAQPPAPKTETRPKTPEEIVARKEEIQAKRKANDKQIEKIDKQIKDAEAEKNRLHAKYLEISKGYQWDKDPLVRAQRRREHPAKVEAAEQAYQSAIRKVQRLEASKGPIRSENAELDAEWYDLDKQQNPKKYPTTNEEKGYIGEEKGHAWMLSQGYTFVGSSMRPPNGKGARPQGLDGVYEHPDRPGVYVVAEMKYDTARLSKNQKKLSWANDNLDQAVGTVKADAIRKAGFEYLELRYDPSGGGRVIQRTIDVAKPGQFKW